MGGRKSVDHFTRPRTSPGSQEARPRLNISRRIGQWCAEAWHDTPIGIRAALGLLTVVVCFSVIVFQFALGLSTVDSLYFVVTTITTVGYGDYNLMNASPAMKVYGSFLMLCGAALMATLFSVVTDLVLRKRLRDLLGRSHARRVGHIIVAGLGSIGYRLASELSRRGESVVAIEQSEGNPLLGATHNLTGVVLGNARSDESLRRAGLEGAKALLAVTDDDLVNLGIALTAKRARPACRVILRLFDSQLAAKMHSVLDVDAVLSVSSAAAPALVGSALCEGVLAGILLGDGLVLLPTPTAGERDARDVPVFVRHAGSGDISPFPPRREAHVGRRANLRPVAAAAPDPERPMIREGLIRRRKCGAFTLQWHLTNACGFHCRHCYDRTDRRELPLAQARDVLVGFRDFCRRRRVRGQICLTGGDPMRYSWFWELYAEIAESALPLSILGNPIGPSDLSRLMSIQPPTYYQVSLEGLRDHNDVIRGAGHFDAVTKFLHDARQAGLATHVMLTLTEANMDQVIPWGGFSAA